MTEDKNKAALDALDKLRQFARSTSDNIPFFHFGEIDVLTQEIRAALLAQSVGDEVPVAYIHECEYGRKVDLIESNLNHSQERFGGEIYPLYKNSLTSPSAVLSSEEQKKLLDDAVEFVKGEFRNVTTSVAPCGTSIRLAVAYTYKTMITAYQKEQSCQ